MDHDYGREFVRTGKASSEGQDSLSVGVMDRARPLQLCRKCRCGCDERSGNLGVGYITGGTAEHFATVWIENEETYRALQAIFWAHGLRAEV